MNTNIIMVILTWLSIQISAKVPPGGGDMISNKASSAKPSAGPDNDNVSGGKLKVKLENPNKAIVDTSSEWLVAQFKLKREKNDKVLKDMTDQFKTEFLENRGNPVTVDYGELKTAKDGEEYYFSLIDANNRELKSSNFKYDESKKSLVSEGNLSDDDNEKGWNWTMIIIFAVAVAIIAGVVIFVLSRGGD